MTIKNLIATAAELNGQPIKFVENWADGIVISNNNGAVLYDKNWQEKARNPFWLKPFTQSMYVASPVADGGSGKKDIRDIKTGEILHPLVDEAYYLGCDCGKEYYAFERDGKYHFFNPTRELLFETEDDSRFKVEKNGTYVITTEDGGWSLHREDKSVICTGVKEDSVFVYHKGKHKNFIVILHSENDKTLLKSDGAFVVRGRVNIVGNGFAVFKASSLFIIDFDVAGGDAMIELEANKDKFSPEYYAEYKQILINLGEGHLV